DKAAPISMRAIDPMNGQVHWPVLSTIPPKASGETIAANAEPVFIMPLAVPEYFDAMSLGMAHIGPIVNSRKKYHAHSATATTTRSCENRIGTSETQQNTIMTATSPRRAILRFFVFSKILSLAIPPSVSPKNPAKNTAEEYNAAFCRSR